MFTGEEQWYKWKESYLFWWVGAFSLRLPEVVKRRRRTERDEWYWRKNGGGAPMGAPPARGEGEPVQLHPCQAHQSTSSSREPLFCFSAFATFFFFFFFFPIFVLLLRSRSAYAFSNVFLASLLLKLIGLSSCFCISERIMYQPIRLEYRSF